MRQREVVDELNLYLCAHCSRMIGSDRKGFYAGHTAIRFCHRGFGHQFADDLFVAIASDRALRIESEYLERKRVQTLPARFGAGRLALYLQLRRDGATPFDALAWVRLGTGWTAELFDPLSIQDIPWERINTSTLVSFRIGPEEP